jgi:hypothetical protein
VSFYLEQGAINIVGISGKARSGKDYVADKFFIPAHYMPVPLANGFKFTAVSRLDLAIAEMWEAPKSAATRDYLQQEGTERGRDVYGEDTWIKHAETLLYYYHMKGYKHFVVPDIRFPNEARWIHALGGIVIRLHGRGGLEGDAAKHISETALDDFPGFDYTVDNSQGQEYAARTQLTLLAGELVYQYAHRQRMAKAAA